MFESQVARRVGAFEALRWCPGWVTLLLISLALPSEFSFSLGSLRLTPYRLVLIAAFGPCLIALWSGRVGRGSVMDWLITAHAFWAIVVLSIHHGIEVGLESGGVRALELYGSYLVARTTIVDEKTFRGAMVMLFAIVCCLAPLVLVESVTGMHVIKSVASRLVGASFYTEIATRMGLARAYGPFDHPILMGVFCASALGVAARTALPQVGYPRPSDWPKRASLVAVLSSMSSGPLAAVTTQAGLLLWDRKTRGMPSRWKVLGTLLSIVYIAVDVISNRSGYHVFLHYLTFSAATAYNRIIIFQWGIQDVFNNPWIGIGFNTWTRPSWMHSTSMDNFWLVQAVTFGVPGFLMIALAVLLTLGSGWKGLPDRLGRLRLGWSISLIGMIVAASTVHFWNSLFAYFFFFVGAGAWFLRVTRGTMTESYEVVHG